MPTLFAAAYLAPPQRPLADRPQPVLDAFRASCAEGAFPFDVGDDPAFFAARYLGGPVTWGVCRPDVRAMITPGDYAAFFAAQREYRRTQYVFVGAFCVERKISHADLWKDPGPFSHYLNLLIRPLSRGWEHFEPALAERHWHKDWLWRVTGNTGRRKDVVIRASRTHVPGSPLPYPLADTYVVFSTELSVIPASPVAVATNPAGVGVETWLSGPRARGIRTLIFANTGRGIRTRNRQQPHRHLRRHLPDPDAFCSALRRALAAG